MAIARSGRKSSKPSTPARSPKRRTFDGICGRQNGDLHRSYHGRGGFKTGDSRADEERNDLGQTRGILRAMLWHCPGCAPPWWLTTPVRPRIQPNGFFRALSTVIRWRVALASMMTVTVFRPGACWPFLDARLHDRRFRATAIRNVNMINRDSQSPHARVRVVSLSLISQPEPVSLQMMPRLIGLEGEIECIT